MVHIQNGSLCGRKKEGAPTLCDSMDGTGKYYAKQYKPGSERQIPYDLSFNRNLINKTNKQTKKQNITKDTEIENSLTVTRGERGGNLRGKGYRVCRNNYKGTRTISRGGWKWGRDVERAGVLAWGQGKRQKTVLEQQQQKSSKIYHIV